MLVEIGSWVIATILSMAGISLPQLAAQVSSGDVVVPACEAYDADHCLASDACEIFISVAGDENCALACDLRDAATCESDGECQVVAGECDFPADEPAGC